MNIAYCITESYLSIFGVSLFSLLENSSALETLNIHILSPDLSDQSIHMLRKFSRRYHRDLYFYNISGYEQCVPQVQNTSGFHPIVFARLLFANYLPESIDSILYLDCDTIVNGDLSPLEHISLTGYAFAAAPELHMPDKQKKNLGLSPKDEYYNAGVLLLNLSYWRTHNLQKKCFDYYTKSHNILLYNDQDILNHCCVGAIYPLSHTYNFFPVIKYFPKYFMKHYQPAYFRYGVQEYKQILARPTIIHYAGDERPWYKGNFSPYRQVYKHYQKHSPWKSKPPIRGKEVHLFCYHILNLVTFICPWFRKLFTEFIGIYYYKLIKEKK